MHLASLDSKELAHGDNIKGNVMVHESASIDPQALVGPNVVLGANCKVGAGSRISNSTMFAGSAVAAYSYMDGSILGWNSTVGKWCRITSLAVIAEDV